MNTASHRPSSYLISLWVDHEADGFHVWRGALVTAAGQRLYFSSLTELIGMLCELAGWQEPSPAMNKEEAQS